ncbi:MAG: hypothetical protein PHR98_03725 [Candidatus Shapirobacteria bacterium]|nr:hypothetical protein [Candidatus Shapirobacteria bacterium]
MNKNKIKNALTQGLLAGYGGQTKFEKATRGSFDISSSHFENNEIVYHDEWTNGGGQEIVKIEGDIFTRVYAGGIVDKSMLNKLGITSQDISQNLIFRINQLGSTTRLFNDCRAKQINNWDYEYKILDNDLEIGITVGKESIKYKDQLVFVHCFVLSSVK